jgi:hypothetical protein
MANLLINETSRQHNHAQVLQSSKHRARDSTQWLSQPLIALRINPIGSLMLSRTSPSSTLLTSSTQLSRHADLSRSHPVAQSGFHQQVCPSPLSPPLPTPPLPPSYGPPGPPPPCVQFSKQWSSAHSPPTQFAQSMPSCLINAGPIAPTIRVGALTICLPVWYCLLVLYNDASAVNRGAFIVYPPLS